MPLLRRDGRQAPNRVLRKPLPKPPELTQIDTVRLVEPHGQNPSHPDITPHLGRHPAHTLNGATWAHGRKPWPHGGVAGVDEAGRGPWAGPVVAAAVILKTRRRLRVRIDDSKRLSPRQRLLAYHAILEHADVGVGIVSADVIDTDNIRQATLQAMAQAVAQLAITPKLVLVDGLDRPPLSVPCRTIVDGDHLSYPIACASIVAKVSRDALMEFYHRVFPDYRFHQHKGYGTSLHLSALKAHGPSAIHRISFQPVAALLSPCPPSFQPPTPHEPDEASSELAVSAPLAA